MNRILLRVMRSIVEKSAGKGINAPGKAVDMDYGKTCKRVEKKGRIDADI